MKMAVFYENVINHQSPDFFCVNDLYDPNAKKSQKFPDLYISYLAE